jgi:hypothetical protein
MDATSLLTLRHAIEAVLKAHGFDVVDAGLGVIYGELTSHIDAERPDGWSVALTLDVYRTE